MGDLPVDEIDELADRIDAHRAGRELIERCSQLPALERVAIELVDLDGLTPKEAAAVLGVASGCAAHAPVAGAGATTKRKGASQR